MLKTSWNMSSLAFNDCSANYTHDPHQKYGGRDPNPRINAYEEAKAKLRNGTR